MGLSFQSSWKSAVLILNFVEVVLQILVVFLDLAGPFQVVQGVFVPIEYKAFCGNSFLQDFEVFDHLFCFPLEEPTGTS